jgi:hypothetical protein
MVFSSSISVACFTSIPFLIVAFGTSGTQDPSWHGLRISSTGILSKRQAFVYP